MFITFYVIRTLHDLRFASLFGCNYVGKLLNQYYVMYGLQGTYYMLALI